MRLKKYIFFSWLITCFFISNDTKAEDIDSIKFKQHFELSFGQSLLFISQSKIASIRNKAKLVVPTNAILFLAQFRPTKRFRYPIFLSIPTETKQFIVNGQVVYERASPTTGFGVELKVFQINIDKKSNIGLEMGPLLSFIFDRQGKVVLIPPFCREI